MVTASSSTSRADEYASAIDFAAVKKAGVRVVKVDFWQGGKKAPTVHLKHGRGLVARYVFTHDCDSRLDVRLRSRGLRVRDLPHSSDDVMVFARESAPPKKKAAVATVAGERAPAGPQQMVKL